MVAAHRTLPDLDALHLSELKALIFSQHAEISCQRTQILSQHEQLLSRDTEIEHLKLLIAKLRRMQFGRKSEKLDRQIEQLELRLDELQATQAEHTRASQTPAVAAADAKGMKKRRVDRCPSTCRAKCGSICRSRKHARTVAAS